MIGSTRAEGRMDKRKCRLAPLVQLLLLATSIAAAHADVEIIPGTRVKLDRPAGFEKAESFAGFQRADDGASIMITELPAPYKICVSGFTNEAKMAERGMKLISNVENKVGQFEGRLVELSQRAMGKEFHKWILIFGDTNFSEIVTATFPEDKTKELSGPMRKAVLSTIFDAGAAAPLQQKDLVFAVSNVPGLKLAARIQNSLVFNESGELPKEKLEHTPTTFVAAQSFSIGKLQIDDPASYARRRLLQSPEINAPQIISEGDINIAGLPGREILATAKSRSHEELFIYQTMLFSDGGYYILRGDCLLSNRKAQEPVFKSIAKTFKLKG